MTICEEENQHRFLATFLRMCKLQCLRQEGQSGAWAKVWDSYLGLTFLLSFSPKKGAESTEAHIIRQKKTVPVF